MPPVTLIDPDAIENLRALSPDDDDAFLKEILTIFLADVPERIADLHAHRVDGNTAAFIRAAHSIKGSSSNVGACEVREIAQQIEHDTRQQGTPVSEVQVAALEAAFARAKVAILPFLG
jgi:HPt (histidine-containing phosphotransfer) domain-containing protein